MRLRGRSNVGRGLHLILLLLPLRRRSGILGFLFNLEVFGRPGTTGRRIRHSCCALAEHVHLVRSRCISRSKG